LSNQEEQQFKNDNLNVTLVRTPGCKVKLDIHVSPQGTNAAYQKALKNVNKEVNIPGFRKGKAPEAYIVQNYGKFIDQEWREILLQTAFKEALNLTQVYPFNEKGIGRPQIHTISKEEGADFSIDYESYPEIPVIDASSITLKNVSPKPVQEQAVDNAIEEIRMHHAQWEEIADRPIQEGDYVDLDIDALEEEEEVKNICKDTRFKIQEGLTAPWMHKLLIGLNLNETVEGLSEKQAEEPCEVCEDEGSTSHHHHHHSEKPFKPTRCRMTVKGIKKANLPDLDDALSGKAGAKTVEELRQKIRRELEGQAAEHAYSRMRTQLEDQLTEKFSFDIPASLVKEQIRSRVAHETAELDKDLSDEEKKQKIQDIQQRIARNVTEAYQLAFISNRIASEHRFEVTQQEIVQEYLYQMVKSEKPIVHSSMAPEEIHAIIKDFLIRKKTIDFLLDQVQKTD